MLDPDPEKIPTWKQLSQLKYLTQTIKETLRLHPSVPLIVKGVAADSKLGAHRVSKGGVVAVHIMAIMRNEKYWGPNADEFDPERFRPENIANRHGYAWIPFSVGPRGCIGAHFAISEGVMTLAMLLRARKFRLAKGDEPTHATTVTMSPKGVLMQSSERRRPKKWRKDIFVAPESSKAEGARRESPIDEEAQEPDTKNYNTKRPSILARGRLSMAVPNATRSMAMRPKGLDDETPEVSMLVLYGSNSGTAEDIARRLAKSGEAVLTGLEISDIKPLDTCACKGSGAEIYQWLIVLFRCWQDQPD